MSWFQLVNATTARQITPSTVDGEQSAAADALIQHDNKWLNNAFTKVVCNVAARLHIYGAASSVTQPHGPAQSSAQKVLKAAISNAITAVTDELCGDTVVLLATPSDKGALSACMTYTSDLCPLQSSQQVNVKALRDFTLLSGCPMSQSSYKSQKLHSAETSTLIQHPERNMTCAMTFSAPVHKHDVSSKQDKR